MALKSNIGNVRQIITDVEGNEEFGFTGFAAGIMDGTRRKERKT